MRPFEEVVVAELVELTRSGVPARGVRLTIRELVVTRFERGPLGAREVSETVEAAVRAACRLVQERSAPEEIVEIVSRATLEAVRGHGGQTTRWLTEAESVVLAVLDQLARERTEDPAWRWLVRRLQR